METAKTWLGTFTYPPFNLTYSIGKYQWNISHKIILALAAFGAWEAFKGLRSLTSTLRQCFLTCEKTHLTRSDGPEDHFKKAVVIVGGDTNIGQAFARELAKRQFNLILLGHSAELLDKLASELGTNEGSVVSTLQYNLLSDWSNIERFEQDLEVLFKTFNISGVINAELELQPDLPFHNIKLSDVVRILGAQVIAPTIITKAALARMELVKNTGFVLYVTSGLVAKPCSKRPLFAAAASYGDYLSQALSKNYGGRIQFHSVRQLLGEDVSLEAYGKFARNCLKWVGHKTVLYGGFLQSLKGNAYAGLLHHFN
mmetsp:Transcript_9335/g.17903  ORF Transcript_9335/g.17903 Transcript_9335/m.17903 type:complete len:313 (-) Transcript_9335:29-967(-)